jgi:hypothetical protein
MTVLPHNGRAAIELAEKGFAVVPLAPYRKEPLTPKWKGGKGVHDATRDPATIASTWRATPEANIGIACGDVSDVVVVDIDPRNGGDETLFDLEEVYGRLPVTLLSASGGGGWHYVYRFHRRVRNRKLGRGIDILSNGKYFVAPPSIHPNGTIYEWARADVPIATLPEWFFDLVDPPEPKEEAPNRPASASKCSRLDLEERGRRLCLAAAPAISGSNGHTTTFSVAAALVRGLELDAATALDLMIQHYNPRCQPPWARWEIEHKVIQAKDRSDKPWGYLLNARRTVA